LVIPLKVCVNERAVVELKAVGGRGGERFGGRWEQRQKKGKKIITIIQMGIEYKVSGEYALLWKLVSQKGIKAKFYSPSK
jgi:hypothetical protein